jgi:hypothetical protein
MERILIFIKHHFAFLWRVIEKGNGLLFILFYKKRMEKVLPAVFNESFEPPFYYKRLDSKDASLLYDLINSQESSDLAYFHPHGFDQDSITQQFGNSSFLMMGAFDRNIMVGYFFLRFFTNKKCFVGRLIDKDYRGKGIGHVMNTIMYETAWRMGFRCLSTISRNNSLVMRAHSRNPKMKVLKDLPNNYLLVEFVRKRELKNKKLVIF